MALSLADVRAARERIAPAAIRTPLVRYSPDGEDPEIFLKLENLQRIGAFKIRGAANAMALLAPEELAAGIVTASSGNMGQGVAWNARRLGVPCSVVMPETAPEEKAEAVRRLGGRVIRVSFERWWQTFVQRSYPDLEGTFLHAFFDDRVMAGQGTIGFELLEDLPDIETVLIPWGGGGLCCGIATVLRELKPSCRIYAVEVETGAPLGAALAAGHVVNVPYEPSFVDGMGGHTVFAEMLELGGRLLDGAVTVSLAQIESAIRLLVARNHVVAEGAGAAALAAALARQVPGRRVACVVSGGNLSASRLIQILAA